MEDSSRPILGVRHMLDSDQYVEPILNFITELRRLLQQVDDLPIELAVEGELVTVVVFTLNNLSEGNPIFICKKLQLPTVKNRTELINEFLRKGIYYQEVLNNEGQKVKVKLDLEGTLAALYYIYGHAKFYITHDVYFSISENLKTIQLKIRNKVNEFLSRECRSLKIEYRDLKTRDPRDSSEEMTVLSRWAGMVHKLQILFEDELSMNYG